MKTFIVTADVLVGAERQRAIHRIAAHCGDHAELTMRQYYPDAARVRAVNARDADKQLAARATQLYREIAS